MKVRRVPGLSVIACAGVLAVVRAAFGAAAANGASAAVGVADDAAAQSRASTASPSPAEATPADDSAIQQIEVTGVRPGPRLWRVSKGDHVAWLLGTLDPLPKRMTWRSREVESVIAQAQEVLAWPSGWSDVSAHIGPISAIKLYIQFRHLEKNPEKASLREWLSPDLYARFSAVKTRFDAHDRKIEELRPGLAALRLYGRAIDASQLTGRNDIQAEALKLARRYHVPITRITIRIEDPRGVLAEVGETPRAAEVGCLDATVERLETDLGTMKARANAWALGDVDTLRQLAFPNQRAVCMGALTTSPKFKALADQAARDWESALEAAIAAHRTTLAMQPIYNLIGPNGTLAVLRAKGYTVEGP